MSEVNSEKIIKHLKEKWKGRACPMCGIGNWNISDKMFELREFHGGNMVMGGNSSVAPVATVTCDNCGNTVLVNGIVAGLTEHKKGVKNEQ